MFGRPQSEKIYKQMCEVIPGGVNSPVRAFKSLEMIPMVVASGKGSVVTDVDGNNYIDYCCSWGASIHGHAQPDIIKVVQEQLQKGTSFGITTQIEGALATKVVQLVPSIEKVRFVSSGTEATMSAIRLARGYTNRQIIVKFSGNYHGHADFFLVQAGSGALELPRSSSAGIPQEIVTNTLSLPYNDIKACKQLFEDTRFKDKIAAVILEPIAGNMGVVPATQEFMQMLREETQKRNIVFILDEVITGFRVGVGGAQSLYNIKPDLTCLGKILGGGFPAAAFGGKKEIMDNLAPIGSVYQAGTLSGNPVAMAAGLEALKLLERTNFYQELEEKTNLITKPIGEIIARKKTPMLLQQVGSMFTLFFGKKEVKNMEDARQLDLALFGKFFRYLFEKGIYIPPSQHEAWFVSSAHTPDQLQTTARHILEFINFLE